MAVHVFKIFFKHSSAALRGRRGGKRQQLRAPRSDAGGSSSAGRPHVARSSPSSRPQPGHQRLPFCLMPSRRPLATAAASGVPAPRASQSLRLRGERPGAGRSFGRRRPFSFCLRGQEVRARRSSLARASGLPFLPALGTAWRGRASCFCSFCALRAAGGG